MTEILDTTKGIASQRAEESVIGTLLRSEDARLELLSSGLEAEHFHYAPYKLAFDEIVERYYGDDPIDALTVAEAVGPKAAERWGISEREAVDRLVALARPDPADTTSVKEHAKIIRRHHDYRQLVNIAGNALNDAIEQQMEPEEIAGILSASATRVVTGAMLKHDLITYADLGRRWVQSTREEIAARQAGVELGAFFGIKGIDDFVKGLRPTETMFLGGDPGVGKTAIVQTMVRNFALRQMRKDADRRVGTQFFSLEMGEKGSSDRFAQMESQIQGDRLRLGTLTTGELREIAQKWAANRELPIVVNHSGELRQSQIKALCIDGIRRHNVGLVVIDHFRLIKTDERFENKNDADEEVVKFLASSLAKDLNLAVICLAHTTKNDNRRPVMDDLRGSKMISAFADVVAFPYWPWKHASQEKRDRGLVNRHEYELIFDKLRSAQPGTGELWIDMSTMTVR